MSILLTHNGTSSGAASGPGGGSKDRRWKRLTELANTAYAQGDIPLALATYTDALTEAERLFDTRTVVSDAVPVPIIFNISCHNLAELFERSGDMAEAEVFYHKAYDRLITTAGCPVDVLEMRISCVQHLKHALAKLVQHLHQRGDADERIGNLIKKANHIAYSVYQVAHHMQHAGDNCAHCSVTNLS